jgi:TolB protein
VLAFVDFREVKQDIFIKKMTDGDEINLTNNPADDFDPDIAEDGSRILFASNRSGTTEVWVMDSDGSNVTRLTNNGVGGQTPRWSRDDSKIAYARGDGSIAVMNADGSDVHTVMVAQPEDTADPCRAGAFVGGWSPDDSRITYYSASVSRLIGQVCTVAVDGSDIQVVVADPGQYDVEPVYSPDGTQIAYRGIINGQHDIWTVDLATGDKHNLTHDADLDIEPDWSPDGQWIVYGSLRSGQPNFDLYIMRPDGSDVRRITSDAAKEANPVWAP